MPSIAAGRITPGSGSITFSTSSTATAGIVSAPATAAASSNTTLTVAPIPSEGVALFDSLSQSTTTNNNITLALRNLIGGSNISVSSANGIITIATTMVTGPTGPTGPTMTAGTTLSLSSTSALALQVAGGLSAALATIQTSTYSTSGGQGYNFQLHPVGYLTDPTTLGNSASQVSIWKTGFTGGASGGTTSFNSYTQTIITGAPNLYMWNGLDQLTYAGTGGGSAQHVARYMQTLRSTFAAGGAANNPQLWAAVTEFRDQTGQKSSLTNAGLSIEVDHFGNNVDDANNRQGISLCIGNSTVVGGANFPYEISGGYDVYSAPYSQYKTMFGAGGNYQTAVLDTRYADGNSATGGVAAPTVTANSSGSTVAVSNVMPFTSDARARDINGGFQAFVYINGVQYTQSGYAFTSNGAAGTITLTASVTVTIGQSVRNNSKTIWMADGHQIAFTTDGSGYINYDPLTSNIHVWGKPFQTDVGIIVYGLANINGATTISTTLGVTGATTLSTLKMAVMTNAANDAAAATALVPVGGFYRNSSVVMQRVA